MDEANFMQTVCWQTRPLAISNQGRGREETFGWPYFFGWYSGRQFLRCCQPNYSADSSV